VALLWTWSDKDKLALTKRFVHARKIFMRAWGSASPPASSYQAFTKILRKWTTPLVLALAAVLRQRMREDLKQNFTIAGFEVFAVDGSRLELARTVSLEARFSPKRKKRSKRKGKVKTKKGSGKRARNTKRPTVTSGSNDKRANSPQMWITVMWHVGTGLPWDWRTGPSDSSERDHFRQMIAGLPDKALVTADAGFAGYEYWRALLRSGRRLLIRVGSNVKLLKTLGYAKENEGTVYLWPDKAAAKNHRPLELRLIKVHTGKHPMYLVTSIMDDKELSNKQLAELYKKRWGIELFYRHFKRTFDRHKLRSHSADNAQIEADWSVVGLWAMSAHAQYELGKQGVPPHKISIAQMLSAYRLTMNEYKSRPDRGEEFHTMLSKATIDDYDRQSKESRAYPRKKTHEATGPPVVVKATTEQKRKAKQIKRDNEMAQQEGLTA
jgi:hypothetical protein